MLDQEWIDRIEDWIRELKKHIYIKLNDICAEGFTTFDYLTAEEASKGEFKPYAAGDLWGRKWEYAWFRSRIILPEEAEGKRIVCLFDVARRPEYMRNVLIIDTGTDSLVYINGRESGCTRSLWYKDSIIFHNNFILTDCGQKGDVYNILAECYAGHGGAPTAVGPVSLGNEPYGEPPEYQNMMGNISYGIWDEDVYQLYIDINTLMELRKHLDVNSRRLSTVDEGLRKFTAIVDFEIPYSEMIESVKLAREIIKPLFHNKNGSSVPALYAFGHAHIDVAWLWTIAETERKCARTFANQLMLAKEYRDYKFLQSSPWIYEAVKKRYPELYRRVKKAINDGVIIPEGGMWVEADTNIPGGESLIRQFLYGKKFFRNEFGIESRMLWLPDVFGYSANLPQIMKGCGINYFSTSKLAWRYHGGDPFPYTTFMWEGIDGNEILTHLCPTYSASATPDSVSRTWDSRIQKDNIDSLMLPFGFGDGGGGPTREHLEYIEREKDIEGMPKLILEGPIEFFSRYDDKKPKERYLGELYFQAHRGTYTSQAKAKKLNRKCEIALREAEMFGVFAYVGNGYQYPADELENMWKNILVNQFHDVIPGSSIAEVYKEANKIYKDVLHTAKNMITQSKMSFIKPSKSITLFNSLSWGRTEIISGKKVIIPPCGYITVDEELLNTMTESHPATVKHIKQENLEFMLENEFLRVGINPSGEIVSIFDKESSREIADGVCNRFEMFKDVPSRNDAWDIDSMYAEMLCSLGKEAEIEICESGVKVKRILLNSPLVQTIQLKPGTRKIEFDSEIDWQENHKLLKVCFPVDIHANEALHEIQFGYYGRPNHYNRQFDRDRFEVCAHKWTALAEDNCGAAVLNNCKYGVNVLKNSINLTLLKSAMVPDKRADRGKNKFKYALYIWNGSFAESRLTKEAYEFNIPVSAYAGAGNNVKKSFLSIEEGNVIIDTVKMAEDNSGDVIIRLYESVRAHENITLKVDFPYKSAYFTNMLEERKGAEDIFTENGNIIMRFAPFEIKTIRLSMTGR